MGKRHEHAEHSCAAALCGLQLHEGVSCKCCCCICDVAAGSWVSSDLSSVQDETLSESEALALAMQVQ